MLDHVSITVSDMHAAERFYDAIMKTLDVVKAMPFPVIETHISNLGTRDAIHQGSIITPAARASIMGLGWRSYTAGLRALVEILREEKAVKEVGKEGSKK